MSETNGSMSENIFQAELADGTLNELVGSVIRTTREHPTLVTRKNLNERYLVMIVLSMTMCGNHYCCDEPAPLYAQFDDWMHNVPGSFTTNFNLLFTMYSLPNIFLPIYGGLAVDRYGGWQMLLVFCSSLVIGQLTFAIGVQQKSWPIMYLGRIIFGLGGENMYTSKAVIIAEWFPENQIAFAFGVGMSLGRLGTVISNFTAPTMANEFGLPVAIWVGFLISLLVFLSALVIARLYLESDKKVEATNKTNMLEEALLENDHNAIDIDTGKISESPVLLTGSSSMSVISHVTPAGFFADVGKFGKMFYAIAFSAFFIYNSVFPFNFIASAILLERDYFQEPSSSCQLLYTNQCTGGYLAPPGGNPSYDESGKECPNSNYAPILPSSLYITKNDTDWDDSWDEGQYVFENMDSSDVSCSDDFWAEACTKNYCDAQDDATEKTGMVMSIPFLIGALITTPLGYLSDTYGHRATMATVSPILIIAAHFQLAFANSQGPIFPLILQGVAFAVYCAIIWPCITLIVKIENQGLAYGVITSLMNFGLSVVPIVVSWIYRIDGHYIPNVEIFFAASGIVGLFAGVALNYYDATLNDGKLNRPYKEPANHGLGHNIMIQEDHQII